MYRLKLCISAPLGITDYVRIPSQEVVGGDIYAFFSFFCKEDLRFMQNDIFKYRGITIEVPDTRAIVDGAFILRVRKKLGMSQKAFARILVTEQTNLSRWENDRQQMGTANSKILYLLDKNPDLIFELYNIVED
jgi:DNA-binding transcriptional regulator YiaG